MITSHIHPPPPTLSSASITFALVCRPIKTKKEMTKMSGRLMRIYEFRMWAGHKFDVVYDVERQVQKRQKLINYVVVAALSWVCVCLLFSGFPFLLFWTWTENTQPCGDVFVGGCKFIGCSHVGQDRRLNFAIASWRHSLFLAISVCVCVWLANWRLWVTGLTQV